MDFSTIQLLYIAISTLVGETFGTMFGGGSFFIQPALLAIGITPSIAVANDVTAALFSSYAYVLFTKKSDRAAFSFREYGQIVLYMAPPIVCGAFIGAHILDALPEHVLKWIIICICGAGVVYTLLHVTSGTAKKTNKSRQKFVSYWRVFAVLAGLGVGMYDGISGAGSGILFILFMTFIFRMDMKALLPIINLLSGISLSAAAITFFFLGLLDWHLLSVMVPASILAGLLAARITRFLPEKILRTFYGIVVFALMLYLLKDIL